MSAFGEAKRPGGAVLQPAVSQSAARHATPAHRAARPGPALREALLIAPPSSPPCLRKQFVFDMAAS
jgi:hypothetical protein